MEKGAQGHGLRKSLRRLRNTSVAVTRIGIGSEDKYAWSFCVLPAAYARSKTTRRFIAMSGEAFTLNSAVG